MIAAAFAVVSAIAPACSCGNKCSGVTCATAQACDPADGVCKCGAAEVATSGGGGGGVVCDAGETCSAELQACVSNLCQLAPACTNGNACDPADGVCKCGGTICAPDELCDPNSHTCQGTAACTGVLCAAGESCNPANGSCVCGGAVCDAGLACVDGGCGVDPCSGVNCAGAPDNACYGGVCRCGGPDGPICDTGQVCVASSKTCEPAALCAGTSCQAGAICGPADGLCHCAALNGPVCTGGAVCVLFFPSSDGGLVPVADGGSDGGLKDAGLPQGLVGKCLGGNLCAGVVCSPGETCDEASGRCLCGADGGYAGFACAPGQSCGLLPGASAPSCLSSCNVYTQPPFVQASACPVLDGGTPDGSVKQACYYEGVEAAMLCEPMGNGHDSDPCGVDTDCAAGYGCFAAAASDGGGSECWQWCDTFNGSGPHGCAILGRHCVGVTTIALSDGGSIGIGACEPTGN